MDSDPLIAMYLMDLAAFPALDREQELACVERALMGDLQARQELIQANLRLVVTCARRYGEAGLPILDLIEEGNLGLMRAVDRFRPEMQCRFATYAVHWIRQGILKALDDKVRQIRLPAYMVDQVRRWRDHQRLHPEISDPEAVARIVGVPEKNAGLIQRLVRSTQCSVEAEEAEGRGEFVDRNGPAPELRIGKEDEARLIRERLGRLDDRDAEILRYRYGLDGYPQLGTQEVAGVFGLSRVRVSQIERESLERLRRMISVECVR